MPNGWERVPLSNPVGFQHHPWEGAGRVEGRKVSPTFDGMAIYPFWWIHMDPRSGSCVGSTCLKVAQPNPKRFAQMLPWFNPDSYQLPRGIFSTTCDVSSIESINKLIDFVKEKIGVVHYWPFGLHWVYVKDGDLQVVFIIDIVLHFMYLNTFIPHVDSNMVWIKSWPYRCVHVCFFVFRIFPSKSNVFECIEEKERLAEGWLFNFPGINKLKPSFLFFGAFLHKINRFDFNLVVLFVFPPPKKNTPQDMLGGGNSNM